MRTAITVGLKKNGMAEIIHHPKTSIHEQIRAFNGMGDGGGKFTEAIMFSSSGQRLRRRRFSRDGGGVDFNASHSVEDQQDKTKAKKLPDLNKEVSKGTLKGGVNFNAALPVEEQQQAAAKKGKGKGKGKKTAKTKAPRQVNPAALDPNQGETDPAKTGVNLDASKRIDEAPSL